MTDLERAQHPLASELRTSCMNSVDLIEYFAGELGAPLERLLEGLRVDGDFLRNTANWIDNYDSYRLYRNCHHAVEGFSHRDWYRVGQASHTTNAPGYFKIILKLLRTDVAYKSIPSMISRTSKVSEYRIVRTEHGHTRLRYAIPNRDVALKFTIGSECWYHLGVMSALPKLQHETSPFAVTQHELCSMPVGHILENCYDLGTDDYEYNDEGVAVFGEPLGKWIRLRTLDGSGDTFGRDYTVVHRQDANALLIVRELRIRGTPVFVPGEIYEAPHCLFDIRYENQSLPRRLLGLFHLGARYYEEQLRKTEELYLELHRAKYDEGRLEQTLRTVLGDPISVPSVALKEPTAAGLDLTHREREIADCVALGMSNNDIAKQLFISTETVKRHLYNIYMKTGVKNRVQLVRRIKGE